jgi:hypothetical protein
MINYGLHSQAACKTINLLFKSRIFSGFPAFKVLGSTIIYGPEVMQSAAGCYHTSLTQQVIPVDATDGSAGTAILQRRKEGKTNSNQ